MTKYPLIRQHGFTRQEKTKMLANHGVDVRHETDSHISHEFNRIFGY